MAKELLDKTLETISNPPPLLTDEAVVGKEDEFKETEASLTAFAAVPVTDSMIRAERFGIAVQMSEEDNNSIIEPQYSILDINKELNQYRRLERNLQIKKNLHFCCSTCIEDGSQTPICTVLEDRNDACLCQHVKAIRKDEKRLIGVKDLLYTERLNATPSGTAFVMDGKVSFPGEVMCCKVCHTRLGYRYVLRDPKFGQFVRDYAGRMAIQYEGPFTPYFVVERPQLRILKITFNTAAAANEAAANEAAANEAEN